MNYLAEIKNLKKNYYFKKVVNGAPARSRTLNLQSRNLALYPVELRAHNVLIL